MTESIENLLFEFRDKKGLTQEELGVKVGVTRQTIISIEKGNYTPSILLSLKLAKFFNTKVENIFKIVKN
jgi:putative transcriptional regulator